ncbi:transcriptional regulator, AraC family with amidase-like domain [Cohaesibacter sp. ES.047]|uniref:GlxA family transcriptional regulator n=1 Tax=Cohaesibacter sp. ES.047 TaxID=1798205 RepID=UPI000BB9B0DD|nr:GlxA family transcriptional regulator [Cohaesibacter sp. ES.047]SNY94145.1 transcriptional regulator, AraC family with amidase-like domain [Cohaesibacter sp. ES.047]
MPTNEPSNRKQLRVAFLLSDRFTLSAFANFVDVLRLAADDADKSRQIHCEWAVLSDDMSLIKSSCGVSIRPDTRLRNAGHYDYVVVVGGLMGERAALSAESIAYLKRVATEGTSLVGLCTGVFILQEAGLLQGYKTCVSWFHHQEFIDRFETEEPVSDQIFVVDRNRLTCSGGHGTAHLAAFLVQRHIGQAAAIKSLNIMMIDDAMSGERPQPATFSSNKAKDPLVKRAILRMQQNIELPKTIDDMAKEIGIGRRTLERRFLADVKETPHTIYLTLRLERALVWLRTTNEPILEIAIACGFCDVAHFSRTMKSKWGMTPSQYRALETKIKA